MTLDELNRSWLRRGMFSPSPWGETAPSLWMETEIFIVRTELVTDEFHGFEGDEITVTVWDTFGHVDQITAQADDQVLAEGGFHVTRRWDIITPIPPDEMYWPIKGDVLAFLDPSGQWIEVQIDDVMLVDQNYADHLEMMAVEVA